jgi:signal transduction histidine kinase
MSIKRYLFVLIGSIVIGVATLQLLLIAYFKQHLNEEIVHKSQQLSTQIIDFAVENVDFNKIIKINGESTPQIHKQVNRITHEVVQKTPGEPSPTCTVIKSTTKVNADGSKTHETDKSVKLNCEEQVAIFEFKTASEPHQVKVVASDNNGNTSHQQVLTAHDIERQKVQWRTQLHEIIEQQHKNSPEDNSFVFVSNQVINADDSTRHVIMEPQQPNAIKTLINDMIFVILASSAVALFLAFWLSNHFTRPLQKLSGGFTALEKGELGIQVKEEGINDYRKTIHSFNHMSQRLATLAESEKTLQQQGHLAELGEVSRGLAHALRNPMHTIGLSVEQLKDPDLPEKLKLKLQDKIQAKIKHIDKTIKALLTLTSGEILRDDTVPLRSVIQDVILEMHSTDTNVNIKLSADKPNLTLQGAESEIRAIVHTLIVNAVEASNNQGNIEIKLEEDKGYLVIEVTDHGAGIKASIEEKLFQPHVSSKAEGAGMGLYISKRLATLYYHGDVTLTNGIEDGCVAIVKFKVS